MAKAMASAQAVERTQREGWCGDGRYFRVHVWQPPHDVRVVGSQQLRFPQLWISVPKRLMSRAIDRNCFKRLTRVAVQQWYSGAVQGDAWTAPCWVFVKARPYVQSLFAADRGRLSHESSKDLLAQDLQRMLDKALSGLEAQRQMRGAVGNEQGVASAVALPGPVA